MINGICIFKKRGETNIGNDVGKIQAIVKMGEYLYEEKPFVKIVI